MHLTNEGISSFKIIDNSEPFLVPLQSGKQGHFFACYDFYIKEFNDKGNELKVYPISPFSIISFALIDKDPIYSSGLICAAIITPDNNSQIEPISTVVVYNTQKMIQLFNIQIKAIKNVFCFENGAASYILITSHTNQLYCFDVETNQKLFTLTFEEPILMVDLQAYIGRMLVQTEIFIYVFEFPFIDDSDPLNPDPSNEINY